MMRHIPFKSLYKAQHDWLTTRFHFSFAEYHNSDNMHYGALRVMNDDFIQAHRGFDTHPHNDMEIITYILSGELTHQDSMGNKESLGRGCMQYLSAGTGITHSEKNEGDEVVHVIQTWILPQAKGLEPQYGSKIFTFEDRHNKWLHLIAPEGTPNITNIYQDANMYVSELDSGKVLTFKLKKSRQIYLKVLEGEVSINGFVFREGDAAEVENENLRVKALYKTHIMLIEMKKPKNERV